jgi:hypothetical protein
MLSTAIASIDLTMFGAPQSCAAARDGFHHREWLGRLSQTGGSRIELRNTITGRGPGM